MTADQIRPLDERPVRRTDVEVVEVGDERVIWDPVGDRVHRLDAIAALIWPFLDGTATLAELAVDVSEVWGVSVGQAIEALSSMIDLLDEAFLLVSEAPLPRSLWPATELDGYLTDPPVP